jgi:trans-aconitate 2-methyltransferase
VTDWDGPTYDRVAEPMTRWGSGVLDRLALRGDERVLDAGCGSGRVTEQLLDRYPGVTVVALDQSPSMLAEASGRLARHAGRVEFVEADLGRPLPLEKPADAVLSTAAFHWVRDHDALFANLAAVMRPGAQLVAQCGGAGNIANVVAVLRDLGETWTPWTFATPEETTARLHAAGFGEVEAWLQPEPTAIEPGEPLATYVETVMLRDYVARLPEPERPPFVRAVTARLPGGLIDYVRLNLAATRL